MAYGMTYQIRILEGLPRSLLLQRFRLGFDVLFVRDPLPYFLKSRELRARPRLFLLLILSAVQVINVGIIVMNCSSLRLGLV